MEDGRRETPPCFQEPLRGAKASLPPRGPPCGHGREEGGTRPDGAVVACADGAALNWAQPRSVILCVCLPWPHEKDTLPILDASVSSSDSQSMSFVLLSYKIQGMGQVVSTGPLARWTYTVYRPQMPASSTSDT